MPYEVADDPVRQTKERPLQIQRRPAVETMPVPILRVAQWIAYFANMALAAPIQAEEEIDFTLRKTKLFPAQAATPATKLICENREFVN